jgi:hypothetical protein
MLEISKATQTFLGGEGERIRLIRTGGEGLILPKRYVVQATSVEDLAKQQLAFCLNCSKVVLDANYCGNCGSKLPLIRK